jgi:chromate transporter
MRAVVAAIVLQVTWALFRPLLKKKQVLPILLFVLSFSALFIFKVNIMLVMVSIVAFSIIQSLIVLQKEKRL